MIDVVAQVKAGNGRYEWHEIERKSGGYTLFINVFRDAMKFDDVPALDWAGNVVDETKRYDGVRLPATPEQLQQIADYLDAMLMTPIVIEELWLQAGLKFNANVNSGYPYYTIAAEMGITQVHEVIEKSVAAAGGDDGSKLVSCVGKYWCLINGLGTAADKKMYGEQTACNFGWCSTDGSGLGVTTRLRCWQRPGFKHNTQHHDPSQTIRLMSKHARLLKPDGTVEQVHLHNIAADAELAPLLHHDPGPPTYLRQLTVPEEPPAGTITLPEVVIEGSRPKDGAGAA